MFRARALMQRTEAGKAYGPVTAKTLQVLEVLLWHFHNAKSGACFPSYEAIAAKAGCARSTVNLAIKALEGAGILSWVNRLIRQYLPERNASGIRSYRYRVIRISNAYVFQDPQASPARTFPSKSENQAGTTNQSLISYDEASVKAVFEPQSPLGAALSRLCKTIAAAEEPQAV